MIELLTLVWIFILYVILIPISYGYIFEKVSKKKEDPLMTVLSAFLTSMILFISFSFANMHFREYEYDYSQEIVAMQDNETMIVSRYNADSKMYYYFMVKNGDTYKSRRVSQNHSTIQFTDEKPKLEVYKKSSTNKFVYFFMPIETYVDDYRYEFYVPKGTIQENFNIDLN